MLVQGGQAGRGSGPIGRRRREYGGRRTGSGRRVLLSVQATRKVGRGRGRHLYRGRACDRGLRLR